MERDIFDDMIKRVECSYVSDLRYNKKIVGEGVGFERIRRVTGYLAGDVKRFNNGKRAEEHDRVKHTGIKELMKKEKEVA